MMLVKALLVWLITNIGGTLIMMTGAEIRGGFEQPAMMVSLGAYIALVSLPAAALLPAFFYWLMRVRPQVLRIAFVIAFPAIIHFLTVYIVCGAEIGLFKVIRNAVLLSPYVLSAAAAMLMIAKEIIFHKENTEHSSSMH